MRAVRADRHSTRIRTDIDGGDTSSQCIDHRHCVAEVISDVDVSANGADRYLIGVAKGQRGEIDEFRLDWDAVVADEFVAMGLRAAGPDHHLRSDEFGDHLQPAA